MAILRLLIRGSLVRAQQEEHWKWSTYVTGLQQQWYENGQLKYERNINKDSRYDGLYQSWYENGQLMIKMNYKLGQQDGLYQEWYENGQLKYERNFKYQGVPL